MREIEIDSLRLHDLTFDEAVALIVGWIGEGSGGYVCTPNVDHVMRARRDAAFRQAVQGARLRVPDGMGIVYGSRLAGDSLRGTVTGRRLPQGIVQATRAEPPTIGLLGGSPGAALAAAERLNREGGRVVAAIGPSMDFAPGGAEDAAVLEQLLADPPQVLFVGLGAPKQELWMAHHSADLPATLMLGIGQGVDVLAGVRPTAPDWMTRRGLEWVYRLAHEPRRLARRYLIDDPPFFWWMLRRRLSRRSRRRRRG